MWFDPFFDGNPGEVLMADGKAQIGGQDRASIHLNEEYEIQDWTRSRGVSPEWLQQAVYPAGAGTDDVCAWRNG